jgi:cytochrome P450
MFPEQVKMVQNELDEVIGVARLPNFEDQSRLPYTQAFLSEIYRVVTMVPVAIPHAATRDGIYSGYRIPEDAIILGNQ